MPVRSSSLEAVENDAGRDVPVKGDDGDRRRNAAEPVRRVWLSQGLSLLAGFALAGLVLLFLSETVVEGGTGAVYWPEATPPPLPEAVPSFDEEQLRTRIQEIAEGHGGLYGVAVLEPGSRAWVSMRGDEEFMTASIGKLPTLATLYRAAARGELNLEEKLPVLPEDKRPGAGGLEDVPAGHSMSLREFANRLVKHSDNTAWAALDRRLGEQKIRTELEGMGIVGSRYHGYLSGYFATPNDVVLLLERISDPRFTSEEFSAEMIDSMTGTNVEDRIPGKLPSGVRVAHKTGSWEGHFGDAGIVFYKDSLGIEKHYYIAILASGAGEGEARAAMRDISLAVYETLTASKDVAG